MLDLVHTLEVARGTEGSIDKHIVRVPSLTNMEMEDLVLGEGVILSGSYH